MEALCHVLVSNPLAQHPRNEIKELGRVNQFTLLPLPWPALSGVWNWSCRWQHSGLVFWAVCVFKFWLRTGCKILFLRTLSCGQSVRAGCVCCWWYIHILLRDRDVYFFFFPQNPSPQVFVLILYVKYFIVLWLSTLLFSKWRWMLELLLFYYYYLFVTCNWVVTQWQQSVTLCTCNTISRSANCSFIYSGWGYMGSM